MKYKAQIVDGYKGLHPDAHDAHRELEPLLQKALDDGVAKGWTLFSVSEATIGSVPDAQSAYWESPGATGYHLTVTLIWDVSDQKPKTPQERKRTTAG